MKRAGGNTSGEDRPWHGLAIWATLASFGILLGILALARNLERKGAGRRWRRADATGEEVDALLPDEELGAAG